MIQLKDLEFFKDDCYSRNLIVRSENVEMLVVCWRPGQKSPPHGHGPSDGIMVILQGDMTNITHNPDGSKVTTVWSAGTVGHTAVGVKHEVMNNSDSDVISLHVYAPPLDRSLQGADMGYDNEFKEVQLPQDIAHFLRGKCHNQSTDAIDAGL